MRCVARPRLFPITLSHWLICGTRAGQVRSGYSGSVTLAVRSLCCVCLSSLSLLSLPARGRSKRYKAGWLSTGPRHLSFSVALVLLPVLLSFRATVFYAWLDFLRVCAGLGPMSGVACHGVRTAISRRCDDHGQKWCNSPARQCLW